LNNSNLSNELEALREAPSRVCQIAGFAVVVNQGQSAETMLGQNPASKILDAFVGPYGTHTVEGVANAIQWAGYLPGPDQILSTWSHHADARGLCVVEGEFYGTAWNRKPQVGRDPELAERVLAELLRQGPAALRELNGTFSGFVFSLADQRLWLFLDPTGSRMLYYRAAGDRCEACSSPYGLSAGAAPLQIDPLSVNEDLAYGAPLDSRTIFQGVRLVPPGKAIEYQGGAFVQHRFFRFPPRRKRMGRSEVAEMICAAAEQHIRDLRLEGRLCCIGLSSGKDSRVVFSAGLHEGVNLFPLTFSDGPDDIDARLAVRVAGAVGRTTQVINQRQCGNTPEAVAASCDSALLSDGFAIGYSFPLMSACASRHSQLLFTGFAGDCLSGSWSNVQPWKARSLEELSQMNLDQLGFVLQPNIVSACLRPEFQVPMSALTESWRNSYRWEHEDFGDLVATHVSMRLNQRNRRWGASFYHAMRALTTQVQTYGDNRVLEAYLSIPVAYLAGQQGHVLAAIHRFPALGRVPTSRTRCIPLKYEPTLKRAWALWGGFQQARTWLHRRATTKSPAAPSTSLRTERFLQAVRQSFLFDMDYLREKVVPEAPLGGDRLVHELAATAIHAECGVHRRFLLPSLCLRPPHQVR
jgi:asparagine synthetase B (glutamine-hydrolysing)